MPTVSLCMIVRDEEQALPRCLDSVAGLVDEIIIVDTGSADGTKAAAKRFTDRIFDFEWIDDFAAARNFAFDHGTGDYLMWLDADDLLLPEDARRFAELKRTLPPDTDAVMMRYATGFDGQGRVTFSYYRERLVKRTRHFRWREPVHEYLETSGHILTSEICVTHRKLRPAVPGRNLAIYESRLAAGEILSPRGCYYYARELKDGGRYADAAAQFARFLDGGQGWVEDNITACAELAECYGRMGRPELRLPTLARSFAYDTPRAEICCRMGYVYKAAEDFGRAAFWFHLALTLRRPRENWGFIQEEYWGYIPAIELAVCCDRLGRAREAAHYNELAGKYKPDDPAVEYNRRYFRSRGE